MGATFGNRLQRKLLELGLKPLHVAKQAGISHQVVYRMLAGDLLPSEKVVAKLAPVLGLAEDAIQAWADGDRLGEDKARNLARRMLREEPELAESQAVAAGTPSLPDIDLLSPLPASEIALLAIVLSTAERAEREEALQQLQPTTLARLRSFLGIRRTPGPVPEFSDRSLGEAPGEEKAV